MAGATKRAKRNRALVSPAKNIYDWSNIRSNLNQHIHGLFQVSLWVRHYKECSAADTKIANKLEMAESAIADAVNMIQDARELMDSK